MGGDDNEEVVVKYGGGKLGHRSWIKYIEEQIFNEPIFEALWNNVSASLKALDETPEWNADWTPKNKADEWKVVNDFGVKWFPLKFGSTDVGKQKSFASVFEYHVKSKRGDWLKIVLIR